MLPFTKTNERMPQESVVPLSGRYGRGCVPTLCYSANCSQLRVAYSFGGAGLLSVSFLWWSVCFLSASHKQTWCKCCAFLRPHYLNFLLEKLQYARTAALLDRNLTCQCFVFFFQTFIQIFMFLCDVKMLQAEIWQWIKASQRIWPWDSSWFLVFRSGWNRASFEGNCDLQPMCPKSV